MGNLTQDRPKCMVELGGTPLLAYQMRALNAAGASEIAIVCGYMGDRIAEPGLHKITNERWQETNMVGSLVCGRAWIGDAPVIVSYTDIVYPAAHVHSLSACDADIALTFDTAWQELWTQRFGDPLIDSESFQTDQRGRLIDIGRKPDTLEDVRGQYMGLLKFSTEGWKAVCRHLDSLPASAVDALDMTTLLRQLIEHGQDIQTVPVAGNWGEVDEVSDLELYERAISKGQLTLQ